MPPRDHESTTEHCSIMFGSQALSSFSAPTKSIQVSHPAVPSGHFPSLAIRPSKRCGRKYGIWYSSLHARTAYT